MAWSFSNFSIELGIAIDDEDKTLYSDTIRLYAINHALRAFVIHVPLQSEYMVSGGSISIAYPPDTYRVASVRVKNNNDTYWDTLPRLDYTSDSHLPNSSEIDDASYPASWWTWNGYIYLGRQYDTVAVQYHAYYATVQANTADIPVPLWAQEAIIYRSAAYCCNPGAAQRARLGQYTERRLDAPPLENSMISLAEWFRSEYNRLIQEHKAWEGGR